MLVLLCVSVSVLLAIFSKDVLLNCNGIILGGTQNNTMLQLDSIYK